MTQVAPPRPATAAPTAPFGRTLAALAVAGVFAAGQLYVAIPLVPAMARTWQVSPGSATGAVTAFGLAYAVGFLVFGPLSDRFGRRRVLVAGLLATAVTTLAVAFAGSVEAGYPLRILQGFTTAAFPPVAMAYLGERITPARRGIAIASLAAAFIAASSIAQLAGQAATAALGWQWVFVGGAVALLLVAALVRVTLLPDPTRTTAGPSPLAALKRLAKDRTLILLYLLAVTPLAGFVAIYTAVQLSGRFSGQEMSLLRAGALPAIVAIPFAARWLGRIPSVRRFGYLMTVAGLSAGLLALTKPGALGIGLVMLAFVFAIGTAAPALVEAIGARAAEVRGAAVSVFTAFLFLGASAGAAMAGAFGPGGFGTVTVVVTGISLLAGALGLLTARRV
ncbi:major facilitator superfamily protein [Longispora fulva]|uniref:Putative MFS family arabinose efflux permease n=1 Tax=Longispora fulva TaxID=619741 RepID=A0A8J7GL50_9ACTN|nr:MFS transporter [Longispora fulva]MBG6140201.1 putative MFS family arabinose efflux permease [Longispora fulva]GIG57422.1 major facilitator superfamily protein [Longispora fulva]